MIQKSIRFPGCFLLFKTMNEIHIEYLPVEALTPYSRNTRKHGTEDVDAIAWSISKYGMNDPIGVWGENNTIVEGHGRLLACKKLGIGTVPIIRLDHMTDEQRREYTIMHNKSAELSAWDIDMLKIEVPELEGLTDFSLDFGMPEEPEEPAYYGHTRERSFKTDNFCDYDGSRVEGPYHFPVIKPSHHRPKELLGFDHMLPSKEYHKGIHFYLYDYMFERIWNSPQQYMEKLSRFDCVIGPDFSLYTDMPVAQQIWNHYRNNLLAQMMQDYGIDVIPPIMWSTPDTFEWCFDGLPHNSVLAVETVGCCQDKESRELWHMGMDAAMKKLTPECIVLYGSDIGYDFGGTEVIRIANTNGERMKKSKEKKANK